MEDESIVQDDLKMSAETATDLVYLAETTDLTKDECLKVIQSVCKKLANEGEEMMLMTVNLTQKTTTCIGSQLGVNFLNHKPINYQPEEIPNVSQMFQHYLEDHYEIANVCNDDMNIPFSPAGSVVMHSPAYTPFSSPRVNRRYKQPSGSEMNTEKLLAPKLEVVDPEYEENSTATESLCDDLPPTITSLSNTLLQEPNHSSFIGSLGSVGSPNFPSPGSQARPILARLLTPNGSGFTRFRSPTTLTSSVFQTPPHQSKQILPGYRFPSSGNVTLAQLLSPSTNSLSPPVNLQSPMLPNVINDTSFSEANSSSSKRGRKRKSHIRIDPNKDTETDDTETENDSNKTVTLRSGRKVKVPAWRKSVFQDALRTIKDKGEITCDIPIKQERISPTFEDSAEDVRVEFDFDLLAELKKESESEQDQSDASSWSGTVHISSSADDSTPSKLPFKFSFNKINNSPLLESSESSAPSTSSLGLTWKTSKAFCRPDFGRNTIDDKFNYYSMFDIFKIEGKGKYRCKFCLHLLKPNESLKNHCFSHEEILKDNPICYACDRVFANADDLKEHANDHTNLLTCHICQELFVTKLTLIQHLNWVHNEMFCCPKCSATFVSSQDLSHHMEKCIDANALATRAGLNQVREEWVSVNENGKVAYKCRSCQDSFEAVEDYNKHMLQHRSKFVLDMNEKMEKSLSKQDSRNNLPMEDPYLCEKCNRCFESHWHYSKHCRLKHGKNKKSVDDVFFECLLCDLSFDEEIDFSGHLMAYHPTLQTEESESNNGEFSCDRCAKRTKTKEGLELHMKIHDEDAEQCKDCGSYLHKSGMPLHSCIRKVSDFKCEECNTGFFSQYFLSGHLKLVHGKKDEEIKLADDDMEKNGNTCNICGKTFRKASDLVAHKSVHTGDLPFHCHLCSKRFRLRSTLKSHLMTHRNYHEFICEVCGRTFKLMESLRLHRRLHNKACYFKCKHCPKEFRAYDGLKYHMLRSHREMVSGNKLKIYKCEYCDKDMATHQQYVRHVSIHTNEKPLKCDLCETRWATISQLNAHKKKHDADQLKFECCVCDIKFPIRSKLLRHMKTAKHIENCKVKNLPVDTVQLEKLEEPVEDSGKEPVVVLKQEQVDFQENVEVLLYEINLPRDANEENSPSLICETENQVVVGLDVAQIATETEESILDLGNQSDR